MSRGSPGARGGTHPAHTQRQAVRFDWGLPGALAQDADVTVVVDVLSFTTTLTVALERGIEVFPFGANDVRATSYALTRDATLAVGRRRALPGEVSLSPNSVATADPAVRRLVLPSPNGSSICFALAAARPGNTVLAASFRNAGPVADAVRAEIAAGRTVALIAAGERWPDRSLRPAVEDLWGAGAVLRALTARGEQDLSVEARVAASAYDAASGALHRELLDSASGRELVDRGFARDVEIATGTGSRVVPRLQGESFAP
ncbi:2-phosphosulfolactate phosphatase [Nocardioides ochotonae]|uniref:2-phosphosulfolactate phosphatase n=1 Tax=Nocardioides ochotonae TaxID=2685869 RepID=UPI001408CA72|nr:2-phosphosulfolactate phosphatase [Nocardioides ochotonae]